MLFVDDLLLSPITGFKFILRTLQRVAEQDDGRGQALCPALDAFLKWAARRGELAE